MPGRGQHWVEGGLVDSTVTSADIKDATITSADIGIFVSAETTGTGSAQNVAHGLSATPTKVLIIPTKDTGGGTLTITEGTHTSTNVVVTVAPSGIEYKVWAMV